MLQPCTPSGTAASEVEKRLLARRREHPIGNGGLSDLEPHAEALGPQFGGVHPSRRLGRRLKRFATFGGASQHGKGLAGNGVVLVAALEHGDLPGARGLGRQKLRKETRAVFQRVSGLTVDLDARMASFEARQQHRPSRRRVQAANRTPGFRPSWSRRRRTPR